MKNRLIKLIVIASLFVSSRGYSNNRCDIERPIKFAGLDWESNALQVAVLKIILEKGYGCKVDQIPGTTLPLLTALGRGDVDVMLEVWLDNIKEAFTKLESENKVALVGTSFPDAEQGFYVPTYLIKGDPKRGIKAQISEPLRIQDLPKYKDLFRDPEKPDKGRFYNCILGWSCETINTKKFKVYGLDKHFTNFRPGTGAALASAIVANYEKGQPFVTYYWGPTWLLGKYDLTKVGEPPYDKKIWEKFTAQKNPHRTTDYPRIEVKIAANVNFIKQSPLVTELLKKYQTTSAAISDALAFMQEDQSRTIEDAANYYLGKYEQEWKNWVDAEAYSEILGNFGVAPPVKEFKLNIEKPINDFVKYVVANYTDFFDSVAKPIRSLILGLERLLLYAPWYFLTGFIGILAFLISRKIIMPIFLCSCLVFIVLLGMWPLAMQTLALMLISTFICIVLGVPIGIFISYNDRVRTIVLPVLDAMQTMPTFVYLIPALMLFGLGKVPSIFATVIYAICPLIRLTDHGIRIVSSDVVEAAQAFGASRAQLLIGVQLPLALPTIMTGINQTTMLALSMVVIASMIGARGLGEQVLLGIQKLDVGMGLVAGLAIVALAIVIDRFSQAIGKRLKGY